MMDMNVANNSYKILDKQAKKIVEESSFVLNSDVIKFAKT